MFLSVVLGYLTVGAQLLADAKPLRTDNVDADVSAMIQVQVPEANLIEATNSTIPPVPDPIVHGGFKFGKMIEAMELQSKLKGDLAIIATISDIDGNEIYQHRTGRFYCTNYPCTTFAENPTGDSQFNVFSGSKMVSTSLVMASVVKEGLASLDSTLAEMLPDIWSNRGEGSSATLQQLMSHTSGIAGLQDLYNTTQCFQTVFDPGLNHNFSATTSCDLECCITQVAALDLWYSPGTKFIYSDLAFENLALIVQRLTGLTFEEAFQKYFVKSLGLTNSTYVCNTSGSTAAHSHPATGLCVTANDYRKIQQMMRNKGKAPDGTCVIPAELVELVMSLETSKASLWNNITSSAPAFNTPLVAGVTGCGVNYLPPTPAGEPPYHSYYTSYLGYGFGLFRNNGISFGAWCHPGNMGFYNYMPDKEYTAVFMVNYNIVSGGYAAMQALYAFEEENFGKAGFCPGAKENISLTAPPLSWQQIYTTYRAWIPNAPGVTPGTWTPNTNES